MSRRSGKLSKTAVLKALSSRWADARVEEMCRRVLCYMECGSLTIEGVIRKAVVEEGMNREVAYLIPTLHDRPVGIRKLSTGKRSSVIVEMYVLFNELFRFEREWDSFVLFHHHGDMMKQPSESDRALTARIRECCIALNIRFGGHYTIGIDGITKVKED